MIKKLNSLIFKVRILLASELDRAKIFEKYLGVKFGKNVRITGIPAFGSEPYLITIGDNVTITHGVTFLNHDGGVGLLRKKHPGIDLIKPITIGNDVFIGTHAIFLPGVTVGNSVVIGSASVITKNIPDNVVVAGVPARVIRSLEEYENKVLSEAIFIKTRSNSKTRTDEIKKALGRSV